MRRRVSSHVFKPTNLHASHQVTPFEKHHSKKMALKERRRDIKLEGLGRVGTGALRSMEHTVSTCLITHILCLSQSALQKTGRRVRIVELLELLLQLLAPGGRLADTHGACLPGLPGPPKTHLQVTTSVWVQMYFLVGSSSAAQARMELSLAPSLLYALIVLLVKGLFFFFLSLWST